MPNIDEELIDISFRGVERELCEAQLLAIRTLRELLASDIPDVRLSAANLLLNTCPLRIPEEVHHAR